MATGEFDVVAELRRRFPLAGDDAAVVSPPDGPLLLAADAVVEGVDFVLDGSRSLEEAGERAVVVNVSDVAAMGGRPLHLLLSIAAGPGVDVVRVVDGAEAAARAL